MYRSSFEPVHLYPRLLHPGGLAPPDRSLEAAQRHAQLAAVSAAQPAEAVAGRRRGRSRLLRATLSRLG